MTFGIIVRIFQGIYGRNLVVLNETKIKDKLLLRWRKMVVVFLRGKGNR